MNIQLFSPVYREEETLEEIRQCLRVGWTGSGFKTVEFEEAWKAYTGLGHAHFLNSATAGLDLAVLLLKEKYGWQDGDEIITSPITFVSTNHAILHAGLKPVFADVDEYLCLDPDSVLERCTPDTKAVMFVGLGGNAGRLARIAEICQRRGYQLILDAAHMAGTKWQGQHVGHEADVSVFSFQAVKNLSTGDGGMICFRDPDLDAEVRKWAWLGINKDTYSRMVGTNGAYKWRYDVEHVGYKAAGNSLAAALGLVGLKYLDEDNLLRRMMAARYRELLGNTIKFVPTRGGCQSSQHLVQVFADNRDEVMLALNQRGIFPGVHYQDNTSYEMYAYAEGTCPRARFFSDRVMSLPLHLRLTDEDIERVCEAVMQAVGYVHS